MQNALAHHRGAAAEDGSQDAAAAASPSSAPSPTLVKRMQGGKLVKGDNAVEDLQDVVLRAIAETLTTRFNPEKLDDPEFRAVVDGDGLEGIKEWLETRDGTFASIAVVALRMLQIGIDFAELREKEAAVNESDASSGAGGFVKVRAKVPPFSKAKMVHAKHMAASGDDAAATSDEILGGSDLDEYLATEFTKIINGDPALGIPDYMLQAFGINQYAENQEDNLKLFKLMIRAMDSAIIHHSQELGIAGGSLFSTIFNAGVLADELGSLRPGELDEAKREGVIEKLIPRYWQERDEKKQAKGGEFAEKIALLEKTGAAAALSGISGK